MTVTIIPAPAGTTLLVEDDDGGGLLLWGTVIGFAITQRETADGRLLGATLPVTLYGYDSHDSNSFLPVFGVIHPDGRVETMDGETWESFEAANEVVKSVHKNAVRGGKGAPATSATLGEQRSTVSSNANLLTNAQAAEYLGISPATLNIWRCSKRYTIPFVKVGTRVMYRKEDLDTWLASRRVGGAE